MSYDKNSLHTQENDTHAMLVFLRGQYCWMPFVPVILSNYLSRRGVVSCALYIILCVCYPIHSLKAEQTDMHTPAGFA